MSDALEFSARLDHPRIPPKAESELKCSLELRAGEELAPTEGAKAMISNICLVFDCSGSMAGEKRETAIDAAKRIVDTIHERHRLSLVGFATTSSTLVDNVHASAADREKIKERIEKKIREFPRGTTNLADGLKKAMRLLAKEKADAKVAIVLSDGGADSTRDAQKAGLAATADGIQIFAVGIGDDYVAEELVALTTPSNGSVFDGSRLEEVGTSFGTILGRIESFVATHAEVEIVLGEGFRGGQIYKTSPEQAFLGKLQPGEGKTSTLHVGNVEAGQTYSFLLSMTAPARGSGKLDAVTATIRYDVPARKLKGQTKTVTAPVEYGAGAVETSAELDAAFRGAQGSELVRQLVDAVRHKDVDAGTAILEELISTGSDTVFYQELLDDLRTKGTISQAKLNTLVVGGAKLVRTPKQKVSKLYDVVLNDPGKKVITVIREIREITGLQLAEVSNRVKQAPSAILEGLLLVDARAMKKRLEAVGARVAVKPREG